tara:strand:- start:409 stop:660 length:252 start_codon:yes stop_codon:yes gene_type:complete
MRKYRIIEEKYEHVSYFYPQYKIESDENGNTIKSEYQYFRSWNEKGVLKRDVYISLSEARKCIEMDIKQRTLKELKETIIHEY